MGRRKGSLNVHNGGITYSFGYKLIRCVGHPRASKKGSYVFEQILVMEKYLGRYLTKEEKVHHINGNKQDNRIENLELMTRGKHSSFHGKKEWKNGKVLFGNGKYSRCLNRPYSEYVQALNEILMKLHSKYVGAT